MTREIEPVCRYFCRHGSCTFTEVARNTTRHALASEAALLIVLQVDVGDGAVLREPCCCRSCLCCLLVRVVRCMYVCGRVLLSICVFSQVDVGDGAILREPVRLYCYCVLCYDNLCLLLCCYCWSMLAIEPYCENLRPRGRITRYTYTHSIHI